MILDALGNHLAQQSLSLRLLDEDHLVDWFDCGRDERMNDWLVERARRWQVENLSKVWILSTCDSPNEIVGFFTLSAHQVTPHSIPKAHRAQDSANKSWVNNLQTAFPATLLGKFALHTDHQKHGLGETLMLCAYVQHLVATSHSASKFLVLDVKNPDLSRYYKDKFGFLSVSSGDEMVRMIKATSAIEKEISEILGVR